MVVCMRAHVYTFNARVKAAEAVNAKRTLHTCDKKSSTSSFSTINVGKN